MCSIAKAWVKLLTAYTPDKDNDLIEPVFRKVQRKCRVSNPVERKVLSDVMESIDQGAPDWGSVMDYEAFFCDGRDVDEVVKYMECDFLKALLRRRFEGGKDVAYLPNVIVRKCKRCFVSQSEHEFIKKMGQQLEKDKPILDMAKAYSEKYCYAEHIDDVIESAFQQGSA